MSDKRNDHLSARSSRLPVAACIGTATFPPEQAATEYAATTIRDTLHWVGIVVQEHWYYLAAGIVLVVLLWSYLRK